MKINKVINMINNDVLFKHDDIDVKKMLVRDLSKSNSVIGNILINLLEQAEEGKFR